jgi:Secretion system C-terminal sorting domain
MLKFYSLPLAVSKSRLHKFHILHAFMLFYSFANAQKTWDGGASTNNWNDGNNWNPDGIPTAADDITISGVLIIDIPNGFTATAKSLSLSSQVELTIDNTGILQIDGSTSTYALSLNGSYINVFGNLQITNCQSGIGLQGTESAVTNTGNITVDTHSGYGLIIVNGCTNCNVVTSSLMSFDNGSTLPAVFFGASGNSGNIIVNSGTMNIGATAHVGIGIGLGNVSGYLLNTGTINIIHAGSSGVSSGFIPGRLANTSSGIINFGVGIMGTWVGGFNLNLQNEGHININKPGPAVNVVVSGNGIFGGSEPFATNNRVGPGNTNNAGCLLFNSGYSNSGTTNIKIGGTTQCSDFDVLFGSTTLDIGGTLNVSLINGFTPTAGQSFTIVNAATRTGTYTTINYPTVPGISWTTSYTATSVIANAQASLPVELAEFTAKLVDGQNVHLEWQTASEVDNAGFEIEISEDGSRWEKIGFVAGIGNSTHLDQYEFFDSPAFSIYSIYYRLRQIDTDGHAELSKVVVVNLSSIPSNSQVSIIPNPTNGFFKINGEFPFSAQMIVYDGLGRVVMQGNVSAETIFDASKLKNGVYTLAIFYEQQVQTCRLLKHD